MRTTVTIDDTLLADAKAYLGIDNVSQLVSFALREAISIEASRSLAALGGSMPDAEAPPRRRFG